MHVVVVGGGWSGLAAAVELALAGTQVTLVEAATTLGGRARGIVHRGVSLDNGQHLLLGAYRETLRLLARIGVSEQTVVQRRTLELIYHGAEGKRVCLRAPRLPAPWHLLAAILTAEGMAFSTRWALLRACVWLRVRNFTLPRDMTVEEWANQLRQPEEAVRYFWEPLCVAALSTAYTRASAQVFLRVCRDAFSQNRTDSDLLVVKRPLAEILPGPAERFLKRHRASIHLGCRAQRLLIERDRVQGLVCSDRVIHAEHVILAVPVDPMMDLLQGIPSLNAVMGRLTGIFSEPISTVYLRYPRALALPSPMVGLLNGPGQWLFDLAYHGEPGRVAVVISGSGKFTRWSKNELERAVVAQLELCFSGWGQPLEMMTVREKRAALACRVDISKLRPPQATPVSGLWLSGDLTDPDYPSTLEAAVRSGVRCARSVLGTALA